MTGQTLREIEIICVDDGSTDSSLQILLEYAAKDDRFIILGEKNLQGGVARNAGLSVATGEFLSFLDSDDRFEPAMLEDAYNAGVRDGSDVVMYGHYECKGDTGEIQGGFRISEDLLAKSPVDINIAGKRYMHMTISSLWNKLFRREPVAKYGITLLAVPNADDLTFACTMSVLANKVSLLPGLYLYYRRDRPGGWIERRRDYFTAYVDAIVALEWNMCRHNRLGRKEKAAFVQFVTDSCRYELSLCKSKQEIREKMALLDRNCGRELGFHVRYKMGKGVMRPVYRLLSSLFRLSWRKPHL